VGARFFRIQEPKFLGNQGFRKGSSPDQAQGLCPLPLEGEGEGGTRGAPSVPPASGGSDLRPREEGDPGRATSNFLDFLMNWYISGGKNGHGGRVLFIAEDQGHMTTLTDKFPNQVVKASEVVGDWTLPKQEHKTGVQFFLFNTLVDRRPRLLRAMAEANVSFLYSDVDIVFLKDPFPFFTGDYDLWVQEDTQTFEGATSRFPGGPPRPHHPAKAAPPVHVLHVRAADAPKQDPDRALGPQHQAPPGARKGPVTNQGEWNRVLYATLGSDVSLGVLPFARFPSGYIFFPGPTPQCTRGSGAAARTSARCSSAPTPTGTPTL